MLAVILGLTYFLTTTVVAAFLGLSGLTLVTGLLISIAIIAGLRALNLIGAGTFPLTPLYSVVVGVIALALAFGTVPIQGIPPVTSQPASIAAPSVPAAVSTVTTAASASDCASKVADDIRGTSATVTLNAYNLEVDNPYSSAVDAGTTYIYRTASLSSADSSNFVSSTSDTSANGVTGFKAGEVISLAGGNASFYQETKEGICITGQQINVNINAHGVEEPTSMSSVVYDSTGATELAAGSQSNKYTRALGANEEQAFFWTIKVNSSDNGYWLKGVAFAVGRNITDAKPGGNDASKFTKAVTPLWMKDVTVNTSNTATNSVTSTEEFTPYVLDSPKFLHEFEEFKFQFNVKASANDPLGAVNTTTYSGVWGISLDQGYVRGSDGKMYLDYWDHTSTEGNVGMNELAVEPNRGRTGFQMDVS